MCVLISSTISYETFLIPRRNERDMIKNVTWYSCKVRVIIVRFKYGLNFLDRFSEKYPDIKFNENPPSGRRGVQCERTDGRTDGQTDIQTDMTKGMVAFRNFAIANSEDIGGLLFSIGKM